MTASEEKTVDFVEAAEADETPKQVQDERREADCLKVTWETPVFDKNNEKTRLFIPGTGIEATITAKHPAGQIRPVSSFEISIGEENFIMSLELISKLFKVRG